METGTLRKICRFGFALIVKEKQRNGPKIRPMKDDSRLNLDLLRQGKPLHPLDQENVTFGCRHGNPANCRYNRQENVCAFVASDKLCSQPPRNWSSKFLTFQNPDRVEKELEN